MRIAFDTFVKFRYKSEHQEPITMGSWVHLSLLFVRPLQIHFHLLIDACPFSTMFKTYLSNCYELSMSKRKCQMRLEFYCHRHCHCHYHHYHHYHLSDSDRYNIHRVLTLHSTWRPQMKKKTTSLEEVCTKVNSYSQMKTLYASRMAGNIIQDGFSLTPIPSGLQLRLSIFTISRKLSLSPTFTPSLVKTKP